MIIAYAIGCIACYAVSVYLFVIDKDEKLYRLTEAYRKTKKKYYAEAFIVSLICSITSWIGIFLMGVAILKKRSE